MNTRFALGLGLVSSLICGTAASADFTFQGLDYRIAETNAVEGDFNWTVEIYVLLNEDERLDAVAGDGINDKRLATSGYFYQNPFGGPTSADINPLLYGNFPSLQYDSWVTIGAMDSTGYPYDNNAILDIGIDWSNFEDNGGDVYSDNGLWFITPKDSQGSPMLFTNQNCEEKYGALVARVTVFGQDENVYLGALFQGKDNLDQTWQATGEITILYSSITDCNENGVEDACDISNGSSSDDNGNGIPDECEFPDCNGNGIDDYLDILKGFSEDCNGNDIPDECEMADGDCNDNGILDACETFDDCNDNGIPDECETFNDCNDNGIPDECEDLQDWDGNGVPDACEGLVAYNVDNGTGYGSLVDAISDAEDDDEIWVEATYADGLSEIDFRGAAVDVVLLGGGSPTADVQMANGASLHVGSSSDLAGITSDTEGTATVMSDMHLHADNVTVARDSSLNLDAVHIMLGSIDQRMGSELALDAPTVLVAGPWTCAAGSTVYSDNVTSNGDMTGTFDLFGSMSNNGDLRATDDVLITQNLTNNGLVAIHRGVLYVFGDLTNNGTILGEVDGGPGIRGGNGPAQGDGMRVEGNYNVGEDASIYLAHENWRLAVGGNFNVAITDNTRFDMSVATLDLVGHTGQDPQQFESMSADLGNTEDGLNPATSCALPIGTIRINSGAIVEVVDGVDNDCAGLVADVTYTQNLVIEVGGELRTNGYIIYTSNFENLGSVDNPDDIIIINPPVQGDLNGDGLVDVIDLLIVVADWGNCNGTCDSDLNNDGTVDVLDLLVLIANWTP